MGFVGTCQRECRSHTCDDSIRCTKLYSHRADKLGHRSITHNHHSKQDLPRVTHGTLTGSINPFTELMQVRASDKVMHVIKFSTGELSQWFL